MPDSMGRAPAIMALTLYAALLAPDCAQAGTNRTGLPMYPSVTNAWAPDSDAQFTCHEYHATSQDGAPTIVAWYHARYPSAKTKRVKFGYYDNSTLLTIAAGKEIVVSPPYDKSSTGTQITLYAGTQCPVL